MTDTQKNAAVEAVRILNQGLDGKPTYLRARVNSAIRVLEDATPQPAPVMGGEDALREAARLIEPAEGEAVFYIRVGGERTHMSVKTKGEVNPVAALQNAIAAIEGERKDLSNCPVHSSAPEAPSEQEADRNLERLIADLRSYAEPSSGSLRIDMSDVKSILALYDRARKIA